MSDVTQAILVTTIEDAVMVIIAKSTLTVPVAVVGITCVKAVHVQMRYLLGGGGCSSGQHFAAFAYPCLQQWDAEEWCECDKEWLKKETTASSRMIIMNILLSLLHSRYHKHSMLLILRWDSQHQVILNLWWVDLTIKISNLCNTLLVSNPCSQMLIMLHPMQEMKRVYTDAISAMKDSHIIISLVTGNLVWVKRNISLFFWAINNFQPNGLISDLFISILIFII